MSPPIIVTMLGPPQGKARARAFLRGGHIRHFTPAPARSYEGMIRTAAMDALAGRPPLDAPVETCTLSSRCRHLGHSANNNLLDDNIRPTTRPDLDNVLKNWLDGLSGASFVDDALIVQI